MNFASLELTCYMFTAPTKLYAQWKNPFFIFKKSDLGFDYSVILH